MRSLPEVEGAVGVQVPRALAAHRSTDGRPRMCADFVSVCLSLFMSLLYLFVFRDRDTDRETGRNVFINVFTFVGCFRAGAKMGGFMLDSPHNHS